MTRRVDTRSVVPRYEQARRYLEELIRTVPYNPGDQLPSERELAQTFRVSQMTMNRALQEMVRSGQLYRQIGKGTFVAEQNSRSARGVTLGLVTIASPQEIKAIPYVSEILRGIQAGAAEFGCDVLLIQEDLAGEEAMQVRLQGRADGFIVVSPTDEALPELRRLGAEGLPFLVLGSSWPDEAIPAVDSDNRRGAAQAVDHLVGLGHSRIGLVGSPEHLSNTRDRHLGFCDALHQRRLSCPECWTLHNAGEGALIDVLRDQLMRIVRRPGGPTAFLAGGYELAASTIDTLQSWGVRVPEDVSVVGFDDHFSAALLNPPLTTVLQPLEEMGRRAVQRLHLRLRGMDDGPTIEFLPTHLIVRGSTAPAKTRHQQA